MHAPKPNPEQATRWDCAQFAAPRCFAGELEGELGSSVLHLQDRRIWEAVCYEVVQQNLMLSSSGSAIPRGGITQNVAGTSCLQAIVACKCPYINPACSPASGSLKNHAGGSHSSFPTPTSALLLGSGGLWSQPGLSPQHHRGWKWFPRLPCHKKRGRGAPKTGRHLCPLIPPRRLPCTAGDVSPGG